MHLILHIGTEKTGTTSFQKWCAENRQNLINQGVFYSEVLGEENHRAIYLWALENNSADEGYAQIGIATPADKERFKNDLPEKLRAEIQQARTLGCKYLLVSNEHCHSRLNTQKLVQNLHTLLTDLVDTIDVICSLRPQVDMAVSLASTAARVGLKVNADFFTSIDAENPYYNYLTLIQRWDFVFGEGAVRIVPFKRQPNLSASLAEIYGINIDGFSPAPRANEALDVQTIAMTNALTGYLGAGGFSDHPLLQLPFDLMPVNETLQIGEAFARIIHAKFESNNSELADSGKIEVSDLTPTWVRYQPKPNLDLVDRPIPIARQFFAAIEATNQLRHHALACQRLAEAERATALRNFAGAEDFLRAAERHIAIFGSIQTALSGETNVLRQRIAACRNTQR